MRRRSLTHLTTSSAQIAALRSAGRSPYGRCSSPLNATLAASPVVALFPALATHSLAPAHDVCPIREDDVAPRAAVHNVTLAVSYVDPVVTGSRPDQVVAAAGLD